jgi:hypothetical protein
MWQAVRVGGDCANIIALIVYSKSANKFYEKITIWLLNDKFHC